MRKISAIILGFLLLLAFVMIMIANMSGDFNVIGGFMFMAVLNTLFVANMALIVYIVFLITMGRQVGDKLVETVKQLGGLSAAWGTVSTIIGLFFAFKALEEAKDVIPFPVICGGMKVGLMTAIYGLIIYCHALVAYIGLNLSRRTLTNV